MDAHKLEKLKTMVSASRLSHLQWNGNYTVVIDADIIQMPPSLGEFLIECRQTLPTLIREYEELSKTISKLEEEVEQNRVVGT